MFISLIIFVGSIRKRGFQRIGSLGEQESNDENVFLSFVVQTHQTPESFCRISREQSEKGGEENYCQTK